MAKNRNAASQRAQKMKNNKVGILLCHNSGCENEFYLAIWNQNKQAYTRVCRPCLENPPQKSNRQVQTELLQKLGILATT
jgi:hypothetical protein